MERSEAVAPNQARTDRVSYAFTVVYLLIGLCLCVVLLFESVAEFARLLRWLMKARRSRRRMRKLTAREKESIAFKTAVDGIGEEYEREFNRRPIPRPRL